MSIADFRAPEAEHPLPAGDLPVLHSLCRGRPSEGELTLVGARVREAGT